MSTVMVEGRWRELVHRGREK